MTHFIICCLQYPLCFWAITSLKMLNISVFNQSDLCRKKRKFELARPPAMTKLAPQRIHTLRTRGGNKKYRALRSPYTTQFLEHIKPIS